MMDMKNTIRTFALVCVAVTSAYIMVLGWRLISILSAPDWCGRALYASKTAKTNADLANCPDLLMVQLKALSLNSHILLGTLALALAVLVIIVLAGGRLSFTRNADGSMSGDIGRDPVSRAAQDVAAVAKDRADDISEDVQ